MKFFYTLLFLFIIPVSSLSAQNADGLVAFAKSGFYSVSHSSLKKILPAEFNLKTSVSLGGEGYYRHNKILVGTDGNIDLENSKIIASQKVKVFSEAIFAKAGYIILEGTHYWLYPSFGMGIMSLDINSYNEKYETTENLKPHMINNVSFDFGINADFTLNKRNDPQGYFSTIAGLRTGYRLSVRNKTWRDFDGNKLYNMPAYAQNGFYVTVAIGYGIFIKK